MEILLGAGSSRIKKLTVPGREDFDIVHSAIKDETYCYVLQAVKPSRIAI